MSSGQLQEVEVIADRPRVFSPPPRPAPRVKAKTKSGQADPPRNASAGNHNQIREKESVESRAGRNALAEEDPGHSVSEITVALPSEPIADPTLGAEQVFASRFRARVGSAPEINSQHRRTRSHFSIPDVTVTTSEEEGKQTHFEVKLENTKRRVTLPTLYNADDDDTLPATKVTASHSSGSEKSQPLRSVQGDTREKPKRKQKPPAIRIIHADDEEMQQGGRAIQSAEYPVPPSTAPMTVALPKSPQSSDEAPFSRTGTKLGKRLRKSSLPNLFGRRERDAADAAAMHALPPSPTCDGQGEDHVGHTSGSMKAVGRREYSRDDLDQATSAKSSGMPQNSNVPTSPTSPSHRPFSPLALLFGSLSNEKQSSQSSVSGAPPDRPLSATPTMSKKEMKRRQKEEKDMIKELEKVDKMVRRHDKQAEKARKREDSKRRKDESRSGSVANATPATPRSPLRRLTFFGNSQMEAQTGSGDTNQVSPSFMSKPVENGKVLTQERSVILDRVSGSKEDEEEDDGIRSAVPTTASPESSSYVPADVRPPVLPLHTPASHASLDLFDSLYEQVNAMELSFGEHYPVEAESRRKSQTYAVSTSKTERESGIVHAAIEPHSGSAFVGGGKAVASVTHAVADSPSSSSTTISSRGQLQRESSSTASLHERDSSSNDSIASSKSSALSPTTPSMPFEAGSFKVPSPTGASDTSDETVPGTAYETSSVQGMSKGAMSSSAEARSVSHPPAAEQSPSLYTKHGKPVRIGVNPRGFRFPPVQPDSLAL